MGYIPYRRCSNNDAFVESNEDDYKSAIDFIENILNPETSFIRTPKNYSYINEKFGRGMKATKTPVEVNGKTEWVYKICCDLDLYQTIGEGIPINIDSKRFKKTGLKRILEYFYMVQDTTAPYVICTLFVIKTEDRDENLTKNIKEAINCYYVSKKA